MYILLTSPFQFMEQNPEPHPFFLTLTFTFNPSANPVDSASKNIHNPTLFSTPPLPAIVISFLDFCPNPSAASVPSLESKSLEQASPLLKSAPVKFHLIQDKSPKLFTAAQRFLMTLPPFLPSLSFPFLLHYLLLNLHCLEQHLGTFFKWICFFIHVPLCACLII